MLSCDLFNVLLSIPFLVLILESPLIYASLTTTRTFDLSPPVSSFQSPASNPPLRLRPRPRPPPHHFPSKQTLRPVEITTTISAPSLTTYAPSAHLRFTRLSTIPPAGNNEDPCPTKTITAVPSSCPSLPIPTEEATCMELECVEEATITVPSPAPPNVWCLWYPTVTVTEACPTAVEARREECIGSCKKVTTTVTGEVGSIGCE